MRLIRFHGRSLGVIRAFPPTARREIGYQLDRVQRGLEPNDWKPMPQIGKGVKELRVRENGQFRVVYLSDFDQKVDVLHAFRKKTRKTPLQDIRTARKALSKLRTRQYD